MDKFAGRYGWDHNRILTLPASTFVGYYAAIRKSEANDFNKQMKAAAFTAWRFEVTISGALGGGANKVSYTDYLEAHNLLTKEEREQNRVFKDLQKARNKSKAREGEKKAADIMAADPMRLQSLKKGKAVSKGG